MLKKVVKLRYAIIIYILVFVFSVGTTFALNIWNSDNTTMSGTTMCFDVKYTNGGAIDMSGMTAALSFSEGSSANTILTFSTKYGCRLYGIGKITVNITSTSDFNVSTGGIKYRVFKNGGSTAVASGSITSSGDIVIYNNFYITEAIDTYKVYFWLDADDIDNTYLATSFSGTIKADVSSTNEYSPEVNTVLSLGDYVSYTPTKTSATTNTSYTGYTSSQTINPSELNLWRVLSINADGTVDLISEYASSVSIYFSGKTGFLNLTGELNRLASQYETSGKTVGSRIFGYSGQTEFITDVSNFVYPSVWKNSTKDNSYEGVGGGDKLYLRDYNLVNEILGTRSVYKSGTTSYVAYWTASRFYVYTDDGYFRWNGRYVSSSENSIGSYILYKYNNSSFSSGQNGYALRPIVTLKSGLQFTGNGTSGSPYVIKS